jgi:hypothetical protein
MTTKRELQVQPIDRNMLGMIRRYKAVASAARKFVLAETFAPHDRLSAKLALLKALGNV